MPLRENSYLHQIQDMLIMIENDQTAAAVKNCTRIGCEAEVLRDALEHIQAAAKEPLLTDNAFRSLVKTFTIEAAMRRAEQITKMGLSAVDLPT